ncbi:MAG: PQQ-binding-like beta-propeller repeat protein [Candidatus Xenobiia bacterium LiM19]
MDGIQRISASALPESAKKTKITRDTCSSVATPQDSVERSSGNECSGRSPEVLNPGMMSSLSSGSTVAGAAELFMDRSFPGSIHRQWSCSIPEGLASEPCMAKDGTLFCGTETGSLIAIKDGKREWELKLGDAPLTTPVQGPDGTIHVSGKHSVYSIKIEEKDGSKIGVKAFECEINEGEERISRPDVGSDGTVYVTASPGKMHALWKGKKKWSYRPKSFLNKGENSEWSSLSVSPDGTVFAGTQGGKVVAVKDGKELWAFKMKKVMQENMTGDDYYNVHDKPSCAPLLGADGILYVATDGGMIYALKDGKEQWSSFISNSAGSLNIGPDGMLYAQGYSIIGTRFENSVYGISKGDYKWSHTPGSCPSLSSRAIMSDGSVLVGTEKGITALSADGKVTGSIDVEGSSDPKDRRPQRVMVSPDDTVYVLSDRHTLKAYSQCSASPSGDSDLTSESTGIEENDTWLVIDGVLLKKKQGSSSSETGN